MTRKNGFSEGRTPAVTKRGPGQLRIVGGKWRGRRIAVPAGLAVRPTPDRIRETLFNWLQHRVAERNCLDLCAGSGALGLEALSRGAKKVVFVEHEPSVARQVAATLALLQATGGQVVCADALRFLCGAATPFDLVFVDPPYAERLLPAICTALEQGGWLAPGALVYLESAARDGVPMLPAGWALHRSKTAGEVGYHLASRAGPEPGREASS
jgi:16S rRNA (guanine966-N2)-methyltransferase